MAIKVVSWNIEGRLTRFAEKGRGSPEHILENIQNLDADVVFLAEASDNDDVEPEIVDRIKNLGYEVHTVSYDDGGKDRKWAAEAAPNMKLHSRLPVKDFKQIRLGDIRNALIAEIDDSDTRQNVRIFGIHLDDRSEEYRLRQVEDLLVYLGESSAPTVVMGDYNAMHAADFRAFLLRNRWLAKVIKRWPHARTQDVLERLSDMAIGDTLSTLERGSMCKDADIRRRATTTPKLRFQEWMPSIRMVQIDHMFVSPNVTVRGFRVGRDGGSDHRPISATVGLDKVQSGQNKFLVL
jgi:endonuclease/exonuclease/phosphatase family metal-dependent hydrolase